MRRTIAILLLSVFVVLRGIDAFAFQEPTHNQLSRQAVVASNLDSFLKNVLNFLAA